MVGCSRDPSAEKYKLYHFVFQITSIDCSVRKVTCHQLSHWPAGKLLPVTPQCAETNGGAQARCVTIGDVTQFPQGVCLTEQVSWSAEMGRGSSMKGLNVGVGDPPPPGPPASAKTSLIPPICFKIAGTKPSLCLQALCQRFQYSVHFLWVTEEKMLPRRRQGKNQIKKQLCIRKPEALK